MQGVVYPWISAYQLSGGMLGTKYTSSLPVWVAEAVLLSSPRLPIAVAVAVVK